MKDVHNMLDVHWNGAIVARIVLPHHYAIRESRRACTDFAASFTSLLINLNASRQYLFGARATGATSHYSRWRCILHLTKAAQKQKIEMPRLFVSFDYTNTKHPYKMQIAATSAPLLLLPALHTNIERCRSLLFSSSFRHLAADVNDISHAFMQTEK